LTSNWKTPWAFLILSFFSSSESCCKPAWICSKRLDDSNPATATELDETATAETRLEFTGWTLWKSSSEMGLASVAGLYPNLFTGDGVGAFGNPFL